MITLALDSSTNTASVAVLQDNKLIHESFLNAGLTHSQTLMPMIQNAFELCGIKKVDEIALTVGPGSFTGLRIAVSSAKGLGMVNDTACYDISSLEALAYNFVNEKEVTIISLIDARLKRSYCAVFEISDNLVNRKSEDECLSFEEIKKVINNINGTLLITGDGAEIFANEYPEFKDILACEKDRFIKASSIAIASKTKESISVASLQASYLQIPQAQRERNERLNIK